MACLTVIFPIVDLWQCCVCCTRSGVTGCTHFVAIPVPCVPVLVRRGAFIAHRYTYEPPRCRTLQYRRTFILLSVCLWNDMVDPVFDGVGLACFKSRSMPCCRSSCSLLFCFQLYFLSLLFLYRLVLWGWGLRTDKVSISLSRPCIANLIY